MQSPSSNAVALADHPALIHTPEDMRIVADYERSRCQPQPFHKGGMPGHEPLRTLTLNEHAFGD